MVAAGALLKPAAAPGLHLEIRSLRHQFDFQGATLPVLDDVSFEVEPGEMLAILGPSGCGKSTLVRLIAGLESPQSGEILADGEQIRGPSPSRVVVFQDPTLYPWRTVHDNVALGLEARGQAKREGHRVTAALQLVGLADFAKAHPQQLSGGMAQRTALARALVNDPRLLILDEPLGKLDSMTRITMQTEVSNLWRQAGFTALLVTHDVEEALYMASRVIVLSDRPARIVANVRVDRDYPRGRGDQYLVDLRHHLLDLLGLGSNW